MAGPVSETPPAAGTAADPREHSVGELIKQLSSELSTLVRQEIDLAKAELSEKGKEAGKGAGFLGGAGLFGFVAFLAITTAVIAALDTAMPLWLAAMIVAVVYGAIAGVFALRGRDRLQEAGPPAPEQTIETLKEDAAWAKTRARSGAR